MSVVLIKSEIPCSPLIQESRRSETTQLSFPHEYYLSEETGDLLSISKQADVCVGDTILRLILAGLWLAPRHLPALPNLVISFRAPADALSIFSLRGRSAVPWLKVEKQSWPDLTASFVNWVQLPFTDYAQVNCDFKATNLTLVSCPCNVLRRFSCVLNCKPSVVCFPTYQIGFRFLPFMSAFLWVLFAMYTKCTIQLKNHRTDFDEIWYGRYAITGYPKLLLFSFL